MATDCSKILAGNDLITSAILNVDFKRNLFFENFIHV